MDEAPRVVTPSSERVPLAIAEALYPGARRLPLADEQTLARARALLDGGPGLAPAFDLSCRLVDAACRLTHGRGIADLDRRAQQRALARLRRVGPLSAVLDASHLLFGLAHFDRPDVRARLPTIEPSPARPERSPWTERVLRAADLEEDLECDALVIGTGAGGAVVGAELAARGHAVVFVEEGPLRGRDELGGGAVHAHRRLYRPPAFAVGNAAVPILSGRLVGGSTAINTGTCFRPPDAVLDGWADALGTEALRPDAIAPFVDRVEARLGVREVEPALVGPVLDVVTRGFGALGASVERVRRNAEGCEGRGFCDFGCPRGARRSVDQAYLPGAVARGALVVAEAPVERLLREGDRITGAVIEGSGRRLHARAVVLAAGALETPHLLWRSGLGGAALGANLSIQPSAGIAALMPEPVRAARQVPQGWCSRALEAEGTLIVGAQPDATLAPLVLAARGEALAAVLERFEHLAMAGVLVADAARGRLVLGPRRARLAGYRLAEEDRRRLHRGLVLAGEAFVAAGARALLPGVRSFARLDSAADRARFADSIPRASELLLTSFHPMGTCRIGREPASSVVDLDHRVHGTRGLFVADGSVLPGPLGVNPQITIMALATRAAEAIDAAL